MYLYPADFFINWKDDVVRVRDLYRERKYRRCAILCAELLEQEVHPIHTTFLHFYQAICYESLGQISHNYSSKKIPLFEQARDGFIRANEVIPLPFLNTHDGEFKLPKFSPICATYDILNFYRSSRTSSGHPLSSRKSEYTSREQDDDPRLSSFLSTPNVLSAIDVHDNSQYQMLHPPFKTPAKVFTGIDGSAFQINHKTRLSRSLSSQHALADELIPSPLFSRTPSSKKESLCRSTSGFLTPSFETHPLLMLSKPLPPTPANRPLPELPFAQNLQFVKKGKRYVIVPRRKTALSTLISRFEAKGPFVGNNTDSNITPKSASAVKTPVTERFKLISAVFASKADDGTSIALGTNGIQTRDFAPRYETQEPGNVPEEQGIDENIDTISDDESSDDSGNEKEHVDPQTPTPCHIVKKSLLNIHKTTAVVGKEYTGRSPNAVNESVTPSQRPTTIFDDTTPQLTPVVVAAAVHLQSYNETLCALRTRLTEHTNTVTKTINTTRAIQEAHDEEKRQRFLQNYAKSRQLNSEHDRGHDDMEQKLTTSPTNASDLDAKSQSNMPLSPTPARISPSKDFRLRSFWSLQQYDRDHHPRNNKGNSDTPTLIMRSHLTDEGKEIRNSHVYGNVISKHVATIPVLYNPHIFGPGHRRTRGRSPMKRDPSTQQTRTWNKMRERESDNKRKERIERLRAEGWNVNKERVGFKGVLWYEKYRAVIEKEIEIDMILP